jgi:hypothetical protein
MTVPPYNAGPGSPEDDSQLRSKAAAGESAADIGRLLKRGAWSVRQRARALKIKLAHSRKGPKTNRK